jgi:hypothetical protein
LVWGIYPEAPREVPVTQSEVASVILENLYSGAEAVTVEVTIPKGLIEALASNDHSKVTSILGKMTPREVIDMESAHSKALESVDWTLYMWTYHISWSFELTWIQCLLNGETEFNGDTLPENLTPDLPLKEIGRWAPQDHMHRI